MANSKFITSAANPIIKNIQLLQSKKNERKKQGLFIIEGIRSINEIPQEYEIDTIVMSDLFDESLLKVSATRNALLVPSELFKVISDTQTPQGVLALVKMKTLQLEDIEVKANGFYLMLENLQDPGNLGTIIRTAHAAGVNAVILTKGTVDIYNDKTIRSTMGSIFYIPIIYDNDLSLLKKLKDEGFSLVATSLEESKNFFEEDLS